jgi:hypothetical protein
MCYVQLFRENVCSFCGKDGSLYILTYCKGEGKDAEYEKSIIFGEGGFKISEMCTKCITNKLTISNEITAEGKVNDRTYLEIINKFI